MNKEIMIQVGMVIGRIQSELKNNRAGYETFCMNLAPKLHENGSYSSLIKYIINYFIKVARYIRLDDEVFNKRINNILQFNDNKHYKLNDEDISNIVFGITKFHLEEL